MLLHPISGQARLQIRWGGLEKVLTHSGLAWTRQSARQKSTHCSTPIPLPCLQRPAITDQLAGIY
jgi:hypothetical protein